MRQTIAYIRFPGNQPNAAFTEYKNSYTNYNDVIFLTKKISWTNCTNIILTETFQGAN